MHEGERVRAVEQLIDGPSNPHERVFGEKELLKYLVNEIQEVYRLQGVNITTSTSRPSRQMMRWLKIGTPSTSRSRWPGQRRRGTLIKAVKTISYAAAEVLTLDNRLNRPQHVRALACPGSGCEARDSAVGGVSQSNFTPTVTSTLR